MGELELWDFLDVRGENVILQWVRDARLSKRDRAQLNQKFTRLIQVDFTLAINTKLLAGPISGRIYKLVIHGDVMLRPMLCKGPINNDTEYTLLLGAVEKGGRLPAGAQEQATRNRQTVIDNPSRRRIHERIPR
jgi:hypothetical protein